MFCYHTPPSVVQGKVVAIDLKSDLALLKCHVPSGRELPVAKIGRSGMLRAGEFVVAMGSPKGLANTCTLGIVSATARPRNELGKCKKYFMDGFRTREGLHYCNTVQGTNSVTMV